MEQKYNAKAGTLRIVFYHPPASVETYDQMPNTVSGNDVIMFLTKDTHYSLFGDKSAQVWKFIHDLQKF